MPTWLVMVVAIPVLALCVIGIGGLFINAWNWLLRPHVIRRSYARQDTHTL